MSDSRSIQLNQRMRDEAIRRAAQQGKAHLVIIEYGKQEVMPLCRYVPYKHTNGNWRPMILWAAWPGRE